MTATIGTSTNLNNVGAVLSAISVDSTTSTTLLTAQTIPGEAPRIKVFITNNGNHALWVKLQPAATDNDKKGIRIAAGETMVLLEGSDIYFGEISAIMNSGGARDVFVSWF